MNEINYNGKTFPIRIIEGGLIIANYDLLSAITTEDGYEEDIDNQIFFYANYEEFAMEEQELFNLICKNQKL